MSQPSREEGLATQLENFWSNISANDLQQLEVYFIKQGEWNEQPIIKDNFETLFENWSAQLTFDELTNILQ